jgi:hypothetical protein
MIRMNKYGTFADETLASIFQTDSAKEFFSYICMIAPHSELFDGTQPRYE